MSEDIGTRLTLPNLDGMEISDLQQINKQVGEYLRDVRDALFARSDELRAQVQRMQEQLAEIDPGSVKKARGKLPPKYRNPGDATETWTGKGKRPAWLRGVEDPTPYLIKTDDSETLEGEHF